MTDRRDTAHKDQNIVQVRLQSSSTNFNFWCIVHKMFVNLTKTSSMSIGSRQNLSNTDELSITIDNEDISNVENQKLLGIFIDKTLSWDKQIDSVCLNITRRITLLKLLYYNSYILPIFDYGCMIWGQCSTYTIKRLLSLQKRVARIILQADFMTPSKEMFQELGWLTFTNIVEYHICVMVFKSLNGQAPDYLSSLLKKSSETNTRNLPSNEQELLKVPFARTAYYEKSFSVTGPKLWNALPIEIRKSTSLSTFKTSVKKYYLNKTIVILL